MLFGYSKFFFAQITRINLEIFGEDEKEKQRIENNKKQKKEKKQFFWEEIIQMLSEFYSESWDEILKWNYYKFNHRLKFVNFTNEKKAFKNR